MRQILFLVFLDKPFTFWEVDEKTGLPGIGLTILLLSFALIWFGFHHFRSGWKFDEEDRANAVFWGVGIIASIFAGNFAPVTQLPIFGYGMMLMIAFLSAIMLALPRARKAGIDEKHIWDLGMWILVSGIVGARVLFIVHYPGDVFNENVVTLGQKVFAVFNLSQGGLVLYGGVIFGAVVYFLFCKKNNLKPIQLADILVPSVLVGVGFGRLGCLMNGCCYGDACSLPWAIQFPAGSSTFALMEARGLVSPDAAASIPLHPSQIYSSMNAFILAFLAACYFPYRERNGDVLALAWIIYPITRFLLERVRGDELGYFQTTLTKSQFISLGMLITGILFAIAIRSPMINSHFSSKQPTAG